jgi:predicted dehydrogenase
VGSPLTIGIVGVGKISEQYFASLPSLPNLKLIAVADLNEVRAAEVAAEQGVESLSVDALLVDDRIDAILNLTIPAAHVSSSPPSVACGSAPLPTPCSARGCRPPAPSSTTA